MDFRESMAKCVTLHLLFTFCLVASQAKECVDNVSSPSMTHFVEPQNKVQLNLKPTLDTSVPWTPITFTLQNLATITLKNSNKVVSGVTLVDLKIVLKREDDHREQSVVIPLVGGQWNILILQEDDDNNLILLVTTKHNHATYETRYKVQRLREPMSITSISSSCTFHCSLEWEIDCLRNSDHLSNTEKSMGQLNKKTSSNNRYIGGSGVAIVSIILLIVLVVGAVLFLCWRYQNQRLKESIKKNKKKLTHSQDVLQDGCRGREGQAQMNGDSLMGYDGPYVQIQFSGSPNSP
ncbi:unnamed protein product [Meganyctiphanes norvegica]|uniref:Uncharacterized protein n=1 Tax=Meganyctiphanes norvegica TaxID=48144 RepID=A0AAV2R951_MEGNR